MGRGIQPQSSCISGITCCTPTGSWYQTSLEQTEMEEFEQKLHPVSNTNRGPLPLAPVSVALGKTRQLSGELT